MNKKGQTLVLFIILLPIIFLTFISVLQMGLITYKKSHIKSVTKSIIINNIDTGQKDDIINLYNSNDINFDSVTVDKDEDSLNIIIDVKIKGITSTKSYHLDLTGYKENDKIKFKMG